MSEFEKTLVILKTDALQRQIIGRIIQKYEDRNLKILGLKMIQVSNDLAHEHYAEHEGKHFYEKLIRYIKSGPVIVMVLEGRDAIELCRIINGKTNPLEAAPGSIRGQFTQSYTYNLVHASDSTENAEREINIYFQPEELMEYDLPHDHFN